MTPQARRAQIRALLSQRVIASQEELRDALLAQGAEVTQATVSRDLAALRARRARRADGALAYELPPDEAEAAPSDEVAALVDIIAHNGALVVIRTVPGAASAVARAIDLAQTEGVLGTVAGDDTVFVAPVAAAEAAALERRLQRLFKQTP